jgi:hypothetical protein
MGEAFKSAKFNIVGGDGAFMERIFNAASMGRTLETFLDQSDVANNFARNFMTTAPQVVGDLGKAAAGAASKLAQSVNPAKPASTQPSIPPKPPTA